MSCSLFALTGCGFVHFSPAVTPVFSPASGTYGNSQQVTIRYAAEGARIHYTTDGTPPTAVSAVYSGPILVNSNVTLSAVAITVDSLTSPVASAKYSIASPSLSFSPASQQITVLQGGIASDEFTFQRGGSFNGPVSLSVSGLPVGVTASWSSNPVTLSSSGGGASTLTLTAAPSAALGTTPITVTACGDGLTETQTVEVSVANTPRIAVFSSEALTMQSAGQASIEVTSNPQDGAHGPASATGATLNLISGLPQGVTSSISAPTIYSSGIVAWTVNLKGSNTAVAGSSTLNLVAQVTDAVSGAVYSASQSVALNVQLTPPMLSVTPASQQMSVVQGAMASDEFIFQRGGSFNGPVSLSVSGLPARVTASWSSNPVTLSSSSGASTLTLTAAASAVLGTAPITVTASGDGLTETQTVNLRVPSGIQIYPLAATLTMQSAGLASIVVTANPKDGAHGPASAAGAMLNLVAGLPSGVTSSISAPTIYSSGIVAWTVNLKGSSSTVAGSSTLNLVAQVTDAVSGVVYLASQSVALNVQLTPPTLSFSPASQQITVVQGTMASDEFTFQRGGSFNGPVSLSVSGLPAGVSASWSSNPVTLSSSGGGASTLTLTAAASAVLGTAPITVTACGDGLTETQTMSLNIPSGIRISVSPATPILQTLGQASIVVTSNPQDGAHGPTSAADAMLKLVSGLPPGVTSSIGAPTIYSSGIVAWTVNLKGSSEAVAGSSTLNLVAQVTDAVSGVIYSASQSVALNVQLTPPMLSFTPVSQQMTVVQGATASDEFIFQRGGSFNGLVSLSVSGLPARVTASWSSNPVTLSSSSGTSTLTLTAAPSAALGNTPITVTASGDGLTETQKVNLAVTDVPRITVSSSESLTMQSAGQASIKVISSPLDGAHGPASAAGATLSLVSGLPSGVTSSIGAPSISSSGVVAWTVNLKGSSAAVAGSSTLNLVAQVTDAVSGVIYSASQSVALNVQLTPPMLSVTPVSQQMTVVQGATASDEFIFQRGGSFNGPVSLSVSGLPVRVTASWSSNPVTLSPSGGASTLTLTAAASAALGTAPITVTASGDGLTETQTVNLRIPSGIQIFPLAAALTMQSAGEASIVVTANPQDGAHGPAGAAGAMLNLVAGLPPGVTSSISAPTIYSSGIVAWTVNLKGSSAAVAGSSTLNLVAQVTDSVSGVVYSASQSVALNVQLTPPTLSFTPASQQMTVVQGATASDEFTFQRGGSFNEPVSLSASGLPAGVTASWSSNPVTLSSSGGGASTLTLTAAPSAAQGTTPITVTASGDGLTEIQTVSLNIPSGIRISVSPATPILQTLGQASIVVTSNPQDGGHGPASAAGAMLNLVSGLPPGVTFSISAPTIYSSGIVAWTVNLKGSSTAVVGSSTLNLVAQVTDAVSGMVYSASQNVALSVQLTPPTLSFTSTSQQMKVVQGAMASDEFSIKGGGSFNGPVSLSVSGLPAGVTASWSSNPVTLSSSGGASTLALTAAPSAALGTTPITVTASGDGLLENQNLNLQVSQAQITFSFSISNQETHTSAGVYNSSGVLVKTLWANTVFAPGTYTGGWDGTTDLGAPVPINGSYTVKLLTNNVNYNWDGMIGSTSENWLTPERWESFAWNGNLRMAFVGTTGWFSTGYAEGPFNFGYFEDTDPNRPMMVNPPNSNLPGGAVTSPYFDSDLMLVDVATDGQWLYFASQPMWSGLLSYVTAFDVSASDPNSAIPAVFGNGASTSGPSCSLYPESSCGITTPGATAWFNTTLSYIDSEPAGQLPPTGIAVQKNGNILAVAHGDYTSNGTSFMGSDLTAYQSNMIRLFDKRRGTSLGVITSISNPTQMAFNSQGLWVLSNGSVYLVSNPGGSNTVTQPIPSLSNPVSLATNSATDHVFILDGGTSQQMKEFDSNFHLVGTYGVLGGYNDCNPTIRNDHLMLDNSAITGQNSSNLSWIRVEETTGDVWIQDGGNMSRILHLTLASASNGINTYKYVNQIQFHFPNYALATSKTMPTRLFVRLFEYAVSYDPETPLQPGDPDPNLGGNGSWNLVKNWGVCADGAGGSTYEGFSASGQELGIVTAEQLTNGQAYVEIGRSGDLLVYELPSSGTSPMRMTSVSFLNWGWKQLFRDGSLGYTEKSGQAPNIIDTVYNAPLIGFDSQDNPQWGSFTPVAVAEINSTNQPVGNSGWSLNLTGVEPTTGGYYPVYQAGSPFNSSSTTRYPHLGAIKSGLQNYAWTTMPEVCMTVPDNHGGFPCTNSYGDHNGIGPEQTEGRNIFLMYDGQYASYGDQIYHYWEDGLLVGQFGNQFPYGNTPVGNPPTGQAGNIRRFTTVSNGNDVYLYHTDEAIHPPIHRWHISNLQSIHEFSVVSPLGATSTLQLNQLF
ncbi:chitobiase/beta-hexosaminidase C-terminal domain-containing protein [Acidicapsa acidisoli]|uniref:chitobiase/beta-hexosaminidase C-terminal domain-containing protein n=1 Tax=Acidicapsa acidisoli TaxID=1615681 RepID=UPI0021E0FBDF|nr:chitobiase/beta-hexosaminidase C-terminal domain-containing protein [Acidicapsa acidisoli]